MIRIATMTIFRMFSQLLAGLMSFFHTLSIRTTCVFSQAVVSFRAMTFADIALRLSTDSGGREQVPAE
jgi:hypothetical protein